VSRDTLGSEITLKRIRKLLTVTFETNSFS